LAWTKRQVKSNTEATVIFKKNLNGVMVQSLGKVIKIKDGIEHRIEDRDIALGPFSKSS
jgi:hypothetical protein